MGYGSTHELAAQPEQTCRSYKAKWSGASNPRRLVFAVLGLTVAVGLVSPAAAQGKKKSRAVVVTPSPGGTEVPVGPNEKVGSVTVVNTPGGPVAVVRVDQMPPKAKFNVITPAGVSHPYADGPTGAGDIEVTWSYIYVHSPNGDYWRVVGTYIKPGRGKIGRTWKDFPPGSQVQPDPPQPPGTFFVCPDAFPADPAFEAEILAELGMPDLPEPEVWWVPSNEFLFFHDAWLEPEIVKIGSGLLDGDQSPGFVAPATVRPLSRWFENFDSYELDSGLHGQGGWKGWDDDPAFDAPVSDAQSRSATQSVDISGSADLVHELPRHSTSSSLAMSAWQYIPAEFQSGGDDQFAGSYFILLNTYEDGGPHEEGHWSVQMQFDSNDGMLKVYHGDGLNTIDVPYITDRWVKIEAIVDLENDWTQVYYDDTLITEYGWTGGVLGDGGGAADIAAVDLFANGSSSVFYDDLVLEPLRK
jgi:hypothetical protein